MIQVVQLKADLLATQEEDFSEGAQEKKRQRLAEKKAKEETAMDQEVQVLMTMQQGPHEVKEPVGASALRRTHDHPAAQPSSDHRIIGSADVAHNNISGVWTSRNSGATRPETQARGERPDCLLRRPDVCSDEPDESHRGQPSFG